MSRHFSVLPMNSRLSPALHLSSDSRLATVWRVLLDKGSALDIPGGETSAVTSPDDENKFSLRAHNGRVTRPHSTSSTSSASTDWSFSGLSELTVTRALISCPSTGSVIVSPDPGLGRP